MGRAQGWVEQHGARLGVLLLLAGTLVPLVDALAGGTFVGNPVDTLVVAAASCLVGARLRPFAAVASCAPAAALLTIGNQVAEPGDYSAVNDLFFFTALVGGAALAGGVVSARARQSREMGRLSRLRFRQHETELRAAGLDERNRIEGAVTRSMAQRMSGLLVQAAGARSGSDPAAVAAALRRLEETARAALDDLREALGSLRSPTASPVDPSDEPSPRGTRVPTPLGPLDVLVACCGAPVAFEAVVSAQAHGPALANVAAGVALGAPLLLRRSRPLTAVGACFVVATVMTALLTPLPVTVTVLLPLSLAAFALGAHTRGRRRLAGLGVLVVAGLAVTLATPSVSRDQGGVVPTVVWVLVAYVAGQAAAQQADRAERLRDLLASTETGRAAEVRLAVAQQRQRIARDLTTPWPMR